MICPKPTLEAISTVVVDIPPEPVVRTATKTQSNGTTTED